MSAIGRPIDDPKQVYVQIIGRARRRHAAMQSEVQTIIDEFLSAIGPFTEELARGEHPVC